MVVMLQLERGYRSKSYVSSGRDCIRSHGEAHNAAHDLHTVNRINESWRRKICEWKYQIVDYYGIDREVVAVSMNYLDRYLSITTTMKTERGGIVVDKRHFQLSAMTCLFLATKSYEPSTYETCNPHGPAVRKRNVLRISALVELSRDYFDKHAFIEMEQTLLFRLKWRTVPPTSVQFIQYFMELLSLSAFNTSFDELSMGVDDSGIRNVYEVARYLSELSVCVYELGCVFQHTSTVALASICSAMQQLRISADIQRAFAEVVQLVSGVRLERDEDVKLVFDALNRLRSSGTATASTTESNNNITSSENIRMNKNDSLHKNEEGSLVLDQNSPVCVSKQDQANQQHHSKSSNSNNLNVQNKKENDDDYSMEVDNCTSLEAGGVVASLSEPPTVTRVASDQCPWDTLVPGKESKGTMDNNIDHSLSEFHSTDCTQMNKASMFRASLMHWESRKVHPTHGPHKC